MSSATGETPGSTGGGLQQGVVSGFATGLHSIPEEMAYAQLAGVNPVFGLCSGMVATLVASLTTGTVLTISTQTSPITLTKGSIIGPAGLSGDALAGVLFTVTLMAGAVMVAMGLLRMGGPVDFRFNAVSVHETADHSSTPDHLGRDNVVPAGEYLAEGLERAWGRARELVGTMPSEE